MRWRAAVVVLLPVLVACPGNPSVDTTPTTAATAATRSPSSSPTPEPTLTSTLAPSCSRLTGGEDSFVHLTGVRVGAHNTFDRVTFEFRPTEAGNKIPKYQIDPTLPPFTEDPSGKPVSVEGKFFAQIIFHGASGVDIVGETPKQTYTGPKQIKPRLEVLVEAQQSGDFEATLSWLLGMSRRSCWTVRELQDPLRLAVDLSH